MKNNPELLKRLLEKIKKTPDEIIEQAVNKVNKEKNVDIRKRWENDKSTRKNKRSNI